MTPNEREFDLNGFVISETSMNPLIALYLIGVAISLLDAYFAPLGWEDDTGFKLGKGPK